MKKIIKLAVCALVLVSVVGLTYGIAKRMQPEVSNNQNTNNITDKQNQVGVNEKPFAGFKLKNSNLQQGTTKLSLDSDCAINSSHTRFGYESETHYYELITFDSSLPLNFYSTYPINEDFNKDSLIDMDNFLDGKQGLSQLDGGLTQVNNAFRAHDVCGNHLLSQLQDATQTEFKPKIYDKYRAVYAHENVGGGGYITFIGIAKKSTYYMLLKVTSKKPALSNEEADKCGGYSEKLNQICFNRLMASSNYKEVMDEELKKNFFVFDLE